MLRFEYFRDNWLDVNNFILDKPDLYVNLSEDFLDSIKLDSKSLKNYRIDAARHLLPMLGDKPALCFSGGIDSQATWQCFKEADINIDVYTLAFNDELNKQDLSHALAFASENDFKLNVINIDILNFLSRENAEYGKKYKSQSPHFNTHYKLCDILSNKGYTGFVCGGGTPLLTNDVRTWASNYNQNFLNYINYSQISERLCQGNFLGYDSRLAWAITLLTPIFSNPLYGNNPLNQKERDQLEYERYLMKIDGYAKAGFKIMPQDKKYTGFEYVKEKCEQLYSDGWAFEKLYRFPLQHISKPVDINMNFKESFINKLLSDVEKV